MGLDAVLFDLGNVLVFHDDARLYQRLAETFGAEPDRVRDVVASLTDEINRGRLAGASLHQNLSQALGAEAPFDRFVQAWTSHFTLNPDAIALAQSLEGRFHRVLLSNTNELHWQWLRPRLPVLERFDALVLSHDTGLAKPDRAIFEAALRLSGARPGRALFFDDVPAYVDAAREAGLYARVFTSTADARETIERLASG